MATDEQRLEFPDARKLVDNLLRYNAHARLMAPVDTYHLVASWSADLTRTNVSTASLALVAKAAGMLLRLHEEQDATKMADVLWELCSLRPAAWLWQLGFEMGVAPTDAKGVSELARAQSKGGAPADGVRDMALEAVRRLAALDNANASLSCAHAALLCEAWTQAYASTGTLSRAIANKIEVLQATKQTCGTRATRSMCADLLGRPQRTMIRVGMAVSVACNDTEGQRIVLDIDAGTYLDITHLDANVVMPVLGREHKRYRTLRTIEQPMQARENLTYLNHIWHTRVYENRDDAQMVDVLLDLEDENGQTRRRYVTLPAADVRPDKKNPQVRYAIVRTREVMLHWYDRDERKTRFERMETPKLSEQMERSYRSYRASHKS